MNLLELFENTDLQRIKFRGTDHDIGEERYVFSINGNPEVFNFSSDEDDPDPDSPSFEEILARVQRDGAVAHHRITPAEQQAIAKKIAAERQRYLDQRRQNVEEGFMDTLKGAARELTRDSLQKKIKQAWENTFWPKHIEPALNRIQIDGRPFRKMVLGEPRVIENDRSKNAILKQYTVNIVFPIDPEQWSGDEIRYLEGQLRDIEDGAWNPKVHGLGLVSFDQPMKSFQYTKGEVPDLVIPVRITSLDINRSLVGEQGVAEGHADQQKTIVKRNGQPVGEVGIDRESSPGAGMYYMKHYASGLDLGGYDSREEALDELRYAIKQGVAEAMKPSDIPPSMRQRLTMRDIEAERPQGAFRFRVITPQGDQIDFMDQAAAEQRARATGGRVEPINPQPQGIPDRQRYRVRDPQSSRPGATFTDRKQAERYAAAKNLPVEFIPESGKKNARIERILKQLRAKHPQAEDDLEALIFDFRTQQGQDRRDIARLDQENDVEEEDIQRLEKMLDVLRRRNSLVVAGQTE